ncbi:MAG: hypothetical protein CHACPFDD_02678 [Phycisphaerae bacterium]|nr:hypothetical protein [Phycisphaerae bacterium]
MIQKSASIGSVVSVLLILAAEEKLLPRASAGPASGDESRRAERTKRAEKRSGESDGPRLSALPDLILVRGGDAAGAVSTSIDASEQPVAVGTAGCSQAGGPDAANQARAGRAFAEAWTILAPLPAKPAWSPAARLADVISRTGPPAV